MRNYEVKSCYNLCNYLNEGSNVSSDDIDIAVDICTCYRKMINDMHNGIIKDKYEIKAFYCFLNGNYDLVFNLENKLTELICQRLFDVYCFLEIFRTKPIIDRNDILKRLPFLDSNIEIEKNIFSKLFHDEDIKNGYQYLLNALMINIYNNKNNDIDMNTIMLADKFIVENGIDYDLFEKYYKIKRK